MDRIGVDDMIEGFEFNPKRLHECVECSRIIFDEPVFRLNPHEVVCLRDYTEAVACLWFAVIVHDRTDAS